MPKRSPEQKLRKYEKKIRKLKEKDKIISDPQNDSELEPGPVMVLENERPPPAITSTQDPAALPESAEQDTMEPIESPDVTTEPGLDPEILSALGAFTSDTPDFGDDIHDNLAKLWTPLLKKGLPKEDKVKLIKEYLIPGNCIFLQAPKLNEEISTAVSEVVRGRDKKLVDFQQQLGSGTSAINRGMDLLLTTDNKIQALKHLSDGCRILTDLHHSLTKDRIKLITPSLEKSLLHMIQDSERDDTLFGNSLSKKIKARQTIERQGSQIRKTVITQRTATVASTVSRPVYQGNWTGPPRFPSNKGGWGGYSHRSQKPRRPYVASATTQPKTYHQPKTRPPHLQ